MRKTMKQYKNIMTAVLAFLAVCLISGSLQVNTTGAYFSDYKTAAGDAPISLSFKTEIKEDASDEKKDIVITNTGEEDDSAVWVRVKAYGNASTMKTTAGTDWQESDGWWYYMKPLEPADDTTTLTIELAEDLPGYDFQIIVVHEAVLYGGEASPMSADWSGIKVGEGE